jgi:hypothetical protein
MLLLPPCILLPILLMLLFPTCIDASRREAPQTDATDLHLDARRRHEAGKIFTNSSVTLGSPSLKTADGALVSSPFGEAKILRIGSNSADPAELAVPSSVNKQFELVDSIFSAADASGGLCGDRLSRNWIVAPMGAFYQSKYLTLSLLVAI